MKIILVQAILAATCWMTAMPASADVLLLGHNHVGDCDDVGGACAGFTPLDPVSRDNNFNTPIVFHLTTMTTITAVRLDNPVSLDGKMNVYIQPLGAPRTFIPGTLSGSTYTLTSALVLPSVPDGYYSIVVDGGCSSSNGSTFFYTPCSGGENDFGYSSITLISPQTSTSRMLIQRRHPGNPVNPANDNDIDDDYDFSDPVSPYYPDIAEGHPLDISFSLDQNRRLSEVRFYRLRDVDSPPGQLQIDGQQVGQFLDTGDPLEINPTIMSTNFLALAGGHTLRIVLGVISGADVDSFSWDNIIIHSVDVAAPGTLGAFNAVDVGSAALNGIIKTKLANKTFDLDLFAINPLGSGVNTAYTGTVSVEILDASDDTGSRDIYGCRASWTVAGALGSVTFAGGDNGKKKLSSVSYPNALRIARVRVTDTSTGARGCSTDALAVRPKEFQAVASDNDPVTPGLSRALPTGGYNSTTTPVHKAGQPFTLRVTPLGEGGAAVTGYDGQPSVTANQLELGTVLGSAQVTGAWTTSGGVLRNDTVSYSEVGAVRLRVEDASFADIDISDGSTATERSIKKDDVKVGRFIPDHFTVTKGVLTPGCGTFSYIGQPFGYSGDAVTLTAVNAQGMTTLGYVGNLFKLGTISQATFTIYDGPEAGTPSLNVPVGGYTILDGAAAPTSAPGTGRIQLPAFSVVRPAARIQSFDAQIGITFPVITDSDGVGLLPVDSPIVMGTAAAGGGAAFDNVGHNAMRYGRLYLQPVVGSDRADLMMPIRTEYFDGQSFVAKADACTQLQASNVSLVPVAGASPAQTRTMLPVGPGPANAATPPFWQLTLSAPNVAGKATVSIDVGVVGPYPYLRDDTDADGLFDNNPAATATFGLFSHGEDGRVYQREVFR